MENIWGKLHEECRYSTLSEQIEEIETNGIKGEIVLIVEGNIEGETLKKEEENEKLGIDKMTDRELVEYYVGQGIDKKEAIKKVAKERGKTKNEVYMECV